MKKIAVIGIPGGWSSDLLADTVEKKTGFRALVELKNCALDLENGHVFDSQVNLHEMDALIIKKAGRYYSPHLIDRLEMLRFLKEKHNIPIFSDPTNIIRVLDRMTCTVTLAAGGIPMPPTAITESPEQALAFVEKYGKAVFKPLYSTKARGMEVIQAGPAAQHEIEGFHETNPVMYLQRMVSHIGLDLGVTFLGGEYLATYARKGSSESWNTTIHDGGKYVPHEPSKEVIDMAYKAQSLFKLDFTCVDIVETNEGIKCFEVSAFGGFRGLQDANGIDAADRYVDYVLGRIS